MSPPITHAARTSVAEPTARAMSLVTRKMPVPIVSLTTTAVADQRPRPRIKSDRSGRAPCLGTVAHMEVREPTARNYGGQPAPLLGQAFPMSQRP